MAKKTIAKSLAVYEKVLKNAWHTTWGHRELWFFGLLAGLVYSGSIVKNIIDSIVQVSQIERISLATLRESVGTASYITSLGSELVHLSTERLVLTISLAILCLALVAYALVFSQHLLLTAVHRATHRKKRLGISGLLRTHRFRSILRLFAIDALIVISATIIAAGASIPLSLFLSDIFFLDFLVSMGVYAIALPLLFLVNTIGMFALIHAVRRPDGFTAAVTRAFQVVTSHWLTAIEMSMILFLLNLLASLAVVIPVGLIALVVTPFFFLAIASGSVLLMTLLGFSTFLVALLFILAYFGAMIVFNYAAWTELAERLERFPHLPAIEGIVRKLRNV